MRDLLTVLSIHVPNVPKIPHGICIRIGQDTVFESWECDSRVLSKLEAHSEVKNKLTGLDRANRQLEASIN